MHGPYAMNASDSAASYLLSSLGGLGLGSGLLDGSLCGSLGGLLGSLLGKSFFDLKSNSLLLP